MKPRILVIGSANADMILKMPHIPKRGETVIGSEYAFGAGGKGANAAVAAARQGALVTFVCCVGADSYGDTLLQNLSREGICLDFAERTDDAPSGLAAIMLEPNGENRIAVYLGANMHIAEKSVHNAFSRPYDAVLLQFEAPREVNALACRLAHEAGIPVVVDAGPAQSYPLEDLTDLFVLSPNETEAERLTGLSTDTLEGAVAAARALYERAQPKYVVLKLGERGALVYDGAQAEHFPAMKITAVDSTAAGDAFTGALALEFVKTNDMRAATAHANIVGALTATRPGAQDSLPTIEDVMEFKGGNVRGLRPRAPT